MVHLKIKQDTLKSRVETSRIKMLNLKNGVKNDVKLSENQAKTNVLTSLLGDLNTRAKDLKVKYLSDEETYKILRYWAKQMTKLINTPNIEQEYINNAQKSKELYESYLPKLMTENEIRSILEIHKFKSIGAVFKFFKTYHNNLYEPSMLSKIYNSEFKG